MKRFIVCLLFLLLLANCVPSVPKEVVQATQESLVIETVATSATAKPTKTPFPTKTSTPTLIPEIATENAIESICEEGANSGVDYARDLSNDKNWFAIACNGKPIVLKVTQVDRNVIWNIPAPDVTIDEFVYPTSYRIYSWSNDNKYLYFVPSYYRGDGGYFRTQPGLLRIELKTGIVETLLEPFGAYDYSLSPNDNLIVYNIFDQYREIYIRDIESGAIKTLHLSKKYKDVGYFEWTLDSKSFVFAAGLEGWDESNLGLSLFLYDIETRSLITLIDDDKRNFLPSEDRYDPGYGYAPLGGRRWLNNDWLILISIEDGNQWEINIHTRELREHSSPTITPTP